MRTLLCLTLLILIGQPSRVIAQDLITFRFHGVVNEVVIDEGPAPPGVGAGSSFDGTYSFDPAAIDTANYDYHGVYHAQAPNAVRASIDDFHWHADKSFVAIVNGEPQQADIYEAGASRMELDSHPDLRDVLDIWIFQLHLKGGGGVLSDASLLLTPPDLSAWDEAQLLMIGDSTMGSLDPKPAVMIAASLTGLEMAGDFQGDGDVDLDDLANWQSNFGSTGVSHFQGDADGDRIVDGFDFLAWQRQLSDGPAAASTIAEPQSCTLAVVVAGAIIFHRRSRRRLAAQNHKQPSAHPTLAAPRTN